MNSNNFYPDKVIFSVVFFMYKQEFFSLQILKKIYLTMLFNIEQEYI